MLRLEQEPPDQFSGSRPDSPGDEKFWAGVKGKAKNRDHGEGDNGNEIDRGRPSGL